MGSTTEITEFGVALDHAHRLMAIGRWYHRASTEPPPLGDRERLLAGQHRRGLHGRSGRHSLIGLVMNHLEAVRAADHGRDNLPHRP